MTVGLLTSSGAGLAINKLRKAAAFERFAARAKALMGKWKALMK